MPALSPEQIAEVQAIVAQALAEREAETHEAVKQAAGQAALATVRIIQDRLKQDEMRSP